MIPPTSTNSTYSEHPPICFRDGPQRPKWPYSRYWWKHWCGSDRPAELAQNNKFAGSFPLWPYSFHDEKANIWKNDTAEICSKYLHWSDSFRYSIFDDKNILTMLTIYFSLFIFLTWIGILYTLEFPPIYKSIHQILEKPNTD